jgi:dipeptidyl aminopeptidase/acylaminoacyl peptidase
MNLASKRQASGLKGLISKQTKQTKQSKEIKQINLSKTKIAVIAQLGLSAVLMLSPWTQSLVHAQDQSQSQFQSNSQTQTQQKLSMEKIMADPDWIGNSPESAYFSADSKQVYFYKKQKGSDLRDFYRISAQSEVTIKNAVKLNAADAVVAESEFALTSPDRMLTVWTRGGNLFVLRDGKRQQLTRTGDIGSLLTFIDQHRVALRSDNRVIVVNLKTGEQSLLVSVKTEDDPTQKKDATDYLSLQQTRLFDIIKKREKSKEDNLARSRELQAQAASAPASLYLGKDKDIRTFSLSPNGRYLLVGTFTPKNMGRRDAMPHYVTADGYVKNEDVRSKVGTDKPANETLYLIDIAASKIEKISFDQLPGITQDPLLALKIDAAKRLGKPEPKTGAMRDVYVGYRGVKWSDSGERLAMNIFSYDNKDRWLVEAVIKDKGQEKIKTLHRLTEKTWINDYDFSEFDWTADEQGLWFLSEESGYSHLYMLRNGQTTKLTNPTNDQNKDKNKDPNSTQAAANFEVSNIRPTRDGKWFYYRANKKHPGMYEVYRVSADGKRDETLTNMGGAMDFELSPNEERLLLTHSKITQLPDLFVQAAIPKAKPERLTSSTTAEFSNVGWIQPEIIAVPSKHGAAPIYSRVYRNEASKLGEKKPAVMFVHGAGYLQAAHYGWSNYFREMMFHNLLVQQGYVVIDMDFRASAGYGRDWRDAIYQRMGTPELEDYLDGIDWLVDNANVDRQRVGIYGGSYGGFMTFMAMFKTDAFAAGAALRPVTDWAHYNHGYTSNILNTPDVDPDAYLRSSPIEFAAGLKRPVLICTGVLDNNVFFQDSVRLVQKLIELKNPNFDLAIYPIEAHGFREPESWLDEYRRIFKLMETEVKGRKVSAPVAVSAP